MSLIRTEILVEGIWVEGAPTQKGEQYREVRTQTNGQRYVMLSFSGSDVKDSRITRLAFLDRFTEDEYATLDIMSIDNPSEDISTRTSKAKLRLYLEKVRSATYIDLSREDTIDGVNALVPFGVITEERALEILTDEILEEERPEKG